MNRTPVLFYVICLISQFCLVFPVFSDGIATSPAGAINHPPARVADIPVPDGYSRTSCVTGSFAEWIRNLPLKSQLVILDMRGDPVENRFYRVLAVLDRPLLFDQDLEQCADFAMRLWADYHKETGQLQKLSLFDYSGHALPFDHFGKPYRQFLKSVFANANSHSIKQGCHPVNPDDLQPGDLIVQNRSGGIGHVSVIMDVCRSESGDTLYLIGFSFMPAQEFHIEAAAGSYGSGGWFSREGYIRYLSDHLDFGQPVYRRFPAAD